MLFARFLRRNWRKKHHWPKKDHEKKWFSQIINWRQCGAARLCVDYWTPKWTRVEFMAQEISMLDKRAFFEKAKLMAAIIEAGDEQDSNPSWPTSMPESRPAKATTRSSTTQKIGAACDSGVNKPRRNSQRILFSAVPRKRFNNRFSRLSWKKFMGLHFYAKRKLVFLLVAGAALEASNKNTYAAITHALLFAARN